MNKAIKKKLQAIHAKLNPAVRIENFSKYNLYHFLYDGDGK